jgi:hypothetical protein
MSVSLLMHRNYSKRLSIPREMIPRREAINLQERDGTTKQIRWILEKVAP